MDLSKQKKPSLPRLATNVSSDRHSTTSLPALAPKIPTEINLHQRPKSERQAIAPFLFPEDDREDENVAPVQHYFPETKPAYVISKSVEDESPTTTKTMYYEDAFAIRGSHNSPKDRVALDSVVIAELATNHKASCPNPELIHFLFNIHSTGKRGRLEAHLRSRIPPCTHLPAPRVSLAGSGTAQCVRRLRQHFTSLVSVEDLRTSVSYCAGHQHSQHGSHPESSSRAPWDCPGSGCRSFPAGSRGEFGNKRIDCSRHDFPTGTHRGRQPGIDQVNLPWYEPAPQVQQWQ